MIQNEREYRITRSQAEKFTRALEESATYGGTEPLLADLHRSALGSQLDELRAELSEYESLKSGSVEQITIDSLDALPQALICARIASGLSQKELAERLGLKEQQVQRYESSAYAGASLTRIKEISEKLGVTLSGALHLPPLARNGSR